MASNLVGPIQAHDTQLGSREIRYGGKRQAVIAALTDSMDAGESVS